MSRRLRESRSNFTGKVSGEQIVSMMKTTIAGRRVTTRLEATVIEKKDFQQSALFANESSLSPS